ncbi:cellulose binding domain-containing protein [Thermosporothrix hazakensis]|uniref:Cellulose binding domain-containing protein n=1 Tax=Thermosporothrix hazakensis TaxID=644383 RepID=A0A326TZX1_THEHA|nr:cellulose binding domain-containing protein [Thermosporothrix hazakensis]PZW18213.1 cellulose binding domain-containing protein [Thermosporothrix hazakensis]GCE50334.1 hypothetical protein KTH_52030 [Thermosporothrix hazakensis]
MTMRVGSGIRVLIVLALALGFLSMTSLPAKAAEVCTVDGTIDNLGKYWLNNNLWGSNTGSGTQCTWDTSISGSTLAWGTRWNWTGEQNSVKSYASAVLGWHWGWKNPNTGLPVQVSQNTSVASNWSFTLTGNSDNRMNVSYDLWFHPTANPGNVNPSDELMVWLYKSGSIQPVGSRQATVTIAGTTWELWRGNAGWNVFSFVRTSSVTSASLDLRDFINDLVTRGWMDPSKYLISVEAGTEIFTGSGQLDTTAYSVEVGGSSGGNHPPAVSLTKPANGASFTAPASIDLAADASDSDGSISKVEFYSGSTLLSTDTSAPYTYTWGNVAAGSYTLTAKAYDNTGAVTTSAPVTVTVGGSGSGATCSVKYSVQNQWDTGFTAQVSITNNGSSAINGWRLGWTWAGNQRITNAWNATTSQNGNQVTATNASYNATIAAGGSVSFGFNGSYSGSNPQPSAFTLNGNPCSVN